MNTIVTIIVPLTTFGRRGGNSGRRPSQRFLGLFISHPTSDSMCCGILRFGLRPKPRPRPVGARCMVGRRRSNVAASLLEYL